MQSHFGFHDFSQKLRSAFSQYTHALLNVQQKYSQGVFHTSVPKDASMIIIHIANKQELNSR